MQEMNEEAVMKQMNTVCTACMMLMAMEAITACDSFSSNYGVQCAFWCQNYLISTVKKLL